MFNLFSELSNKIDPTIENKFWDSSVTTQTITQILALLKYFIDETKPWITNDRSL